MGDDDRTLAAAARDGDERAFAALVVRHEAAVRRFLGRAAGHAADDLAQEALLKAWRRRADWRGDGSYRGWLLRLAWTAFLDATRSAKRGAARDAAWAEQPVLAPDPDIAVAVAQALAELAPRERAAAELCFAQGFSHGEAADILGLPLGTLKSVVARARVRLAQLLGDDE
ncbi:MAG: RNA polymerase sigma factor [Novosphingobium sp.]